MNQRSALEIAAAVRSGRITASAVVADTLRDITARDPALGCFTAVFAQQALADAAALDARFAQGLDVGPLAGAPFAVKNLYDVAGVVTLAGSKIRRDCAPATRDATLAARLKQAGAILVGALNMDEFAYGFVTENAHYGTTRNPHDPGRIAGGSSGGSAAAVAAGLIPLSLGSDTNGSIRVPAALCGVYGLRPSRGVLPRDGVYSFVDSLDEGGPFARSLDDLAAVWDVLRDEGSTPLSPRMGDFAATPLRVGVLTGWFTRGAAAEVIEALGVVGNALNADPKVEFGGAAAARSAAFVISAFEGGRLHLEDLRRRAADYDPAVRDRLLAGALLPAEVAEEARRIEPVFREAAARLFDSYDVLIAPTTPCPAPPIGATTMVIDGQAVSVRRNLGAYTQPISLIGAPVLAAPVNRPDACRSASRSSPTTAARTWRSPRPCNWRRAGSSPPIRRRPIVLPINDAGVVAEVRAAVDAYETALMTNDVATLDGAFWASPHTVRYGVAENLYGFDEIAAFRVGRRGGSPPRERLRTEIVALGPDVAVANVEFVRTDTGRNGRQSQTWLRTDEGWKVVAAHVSLRQGDADQRG